MGLKFFVLLRVTILLILNIFVITLVIGQWVYRGWYGMWLRGLWGTAYDLLAHPNVSSNSHLTHGSYSELIKFYYIIFSNIIEGFVEIAAFFSFRKSLKFRFFSWQWKTSICKLNLCEHSISCFFAHEQKCILLQDNITILLRDFINLIFLQPKKIRKNQLIIVFIISQFLLILFIWRLLRTIHTMK